MIERIVASDNSVIYCVMLRGEGVAMMDSIPISEKRPVKLNGIVTTQLQNNTEY